MPAPKRIVDLVKYFRNNLESLRSGTYSEALVRQELINPLFEELGWDMSNRSLRPPESREVIHEASLRIGGTMKAPDYSFRIDSRRKLFVEAKKPSVKVAEDRSAAYQIRRYCWNAGLPFGVVTDFEEFAVYDCRTQPNPSDNASASRTHYFMFDEYPGRWDWLVETFGRDSVAGGSLDRLSTTVQVPRGTRTIDQAFLDEIRSWRQLLAEDLAPRNPNLDSAGLNSAVQTLIDRIIFLRIAESRGLEPERELDRTRGDGSEIYSRLFRLFERADDRYNSGLFHFRQERGRNTKPDSQATSLVVGDNALNRVLARLYYPEPYEFSVIPADILGQVYEQFLGEVIVLGPSRAATVEIKPEIRRSGGIYYTPQPIVEYIVRKTLGPLLAGRTIPQAEKIRILDPACGSGSFLISAYQYLIDWHLEQYLQRGRAGQRFIEKTSDGQARLVTSERKRILVNCIFGVDIDPQAAEVAKLSLLLKLIEGQQQFELEVGRLLPDLDGNILCGNSLVETDVHSIAPDAAALDVNPFDWHESFHAILTNGGFDAIIGNPPYFSIDSVWGRNDPRLSYIKQKYEAVYADKTDVLFYFIKRAVDLTRGDVSFIVSRSFLEAFKARKLRGWMSEETRIREILDFQHAMVFPGIGINTSILRLTKSRRTGPALTRKLVPRSLPVGYSDETLEEETLYDSLTVDQSKFGEDSWLFGSADVDAVIGRLDRAGVPVREVMKVGKGMETGRNGVFQGLEPTKATESYFFRRARNSDIHRYQISPSGPPILYVEDIATIDALPREVAAHLTDHEDILKSRAAYQRGNCEWWKYTWPLHSAFVRRPRIFTPYMAQHNRFALDADCTYLGLTDTTVLYDNGQPEDLRYIVGVLNSRALEFRFRFLGKLRGGGVYEYYENTVGKLPLPRQNPGSRLHDDIVNHVKRCEALTMELSGYRPDTEDYRLTQAELLTTERDIDLLVYELFGLQDSEIAAIESVLMQTARDGAVADG